MEIIKISEQGIGYGIVKGQKIFVEKTCIGDVVENGQIIKKSKDRREPICPYYDECGGCNLLHLRDEIYYDFKGKFCNNNLIKINPNARRRATFKIKNGKIGFFKRNSNEIVEIKKCFVLRNEINELLPKLKTNADEVSITLYANGIGLIFNFNREPNNNFMKKIFTEEEKIITISYRINDGEPFLFLQKQRPIVYFDKVKVEVDDDIFLQATEEGQEAIIKIVLEHLKNCKNVFDLYCGVGTYTIPLAQYTKVHSIEGIDRMIQLLKNNIGVKKITVEVRDLVKQPLLTEELKCDGIVINPPRSGAKVQCKYIAKTSTIKKIVMVSCNHRTFYEDLEILKAGGFILQNIWGLDQFYGNAHLEIIGTLNR